MGSRSSAAVIALFEYCADHGERVNFLDFEKLLKSELLALATYALSSTMQKKDTEFSNTILEDVASNTSSYKEHVFQDPEVAEYYRKIYYENNYEGKDHFDPDLEWSPSEEKRLVRKTELRVTGLAFFLFFALDIDRSNINNALSDNMLDQLGMTNNDLNLGKTLNLIFFILAEIPAQLISKKIGCDVWIPLEMTLWSIIAMCQAGLTNRTGFLITRALLGMLQGGFIADVNLWLSYFYTGRELPMRITIFYIANPLTEVIGSLLGYGILHMDGIKGLAGWKWLFLLEGLLTLCIGIFAFFAMPPSPVQTKAPWRKKGWYTEREEKVMVNRILRDDPSKGDMNNRQALSFRELFKAFFDWDLLPIYFIRTLGDIGVAPVKNYFTLLLRQMGFSTFNTNLLSIPSNILAIITMVSLSWFVSFFKNGNSLAQYIQTIWYFPLLIVLRYWKGAELTGQSNLWATYAILVLALGYPVAEPITITWCSANSNSVSTRAISAAVVNIFSQIAGIISNNIYREDDAPLYHRGNFQLIMIAIGQLALITLSLFYYKWRNQRKEKKWNELDNDEKIEYLKNTPDKGNKRLDFRFVY
ncbi:hypothetical protein TRICI_003073 [Trichomonascus ciferrii]|uniref:Major facilitator superfamily (MFS) profile domain-containing protein n=1 Tax=Trichomonascus ciferrii TaxID=44093 RepID=A0A6A1LV54_9ASCO|nr:hypothetical protein TRICI_003073 [Trichomonascus ciferrii]